MHTKTFEEQTKAFDEQTKTFEEQTKSWNVLKVWYNDTIIQAKHQIMTSFNFEGIEH